MAANGEQPFAGKIAERRKLGAASTDRCNTLIYMFHRWSVNYDLPNPYQIHCGAEG